jgi:DNA-binding protein HU-beta
MAKKKAVEAPVEVVETKGTIFGKEDMVKAIQEELKAGDHPVEVSQGVIGKILDAEKSLILGALQNGDKVRYIGHGVYEVRERQARKGRNPQTGEELEIAGGKYPAFKPGKALKDALK